MRKSRFYFVEGMPVGPERAAPGTAEPDKWRPYKIWSGDKWQCDGCGATILSGFGLQPVAVQHEDDFEHYRESLNAKQYQVNDC